MAGPSTRARTVPGRDPRAVLDEDLDGGRGVEEREDAREERGAGDDGRLAADHVAGDAGLRAEDGEGGDVLSVLGERACQEVVQGFDEVSIDLHEKQHSRRAGGCAAGVPPIGWPPRWRNRRWPDP